MGCRSRLASLEINGDVTQRLKELPTIISKLVREEGRVQLSTMEDVAGARTVVDTVDDLRRLEGRWLDTRFPVPRHRDYIDDPPSSGYRGVHLILQHRDRLVEIQLRSRIQHRWAEVVEQLGHDLGAAFKNQEGPSDVLATLAELAEQLAQIEGSHAPYAARQQQAEDAVRQVRAAIRRGVT